MVNIKVAVRIRPLSQRELAQKEEVVVRKENNSVVVTNPKIPERQDGDSRQRTRRFSVDFCYDAADPEGSSQEAVYREIGTEILDAMFEGYNGCVLAYGHSASGKTHTIMGVEGDPGLTPRLCEGLFRRIKDLPCDGSVRVEVAASFLEIYNEKVKDLLGSEDTGAASCSFSLRVREHPKLGPYVQGLSEHLVTDERALLELLAAGNGRRSTAATENNTHSSRSHAVFTIHFRQSDGGKCETEKWSKVHLVDLAGSLPEGPQQESPANERATAAQSKARLQEGANINKSLVTLGNVISALAESLESVGVPREQQKSWHPFVPYRDSVLTWLLKDTLGGNSNTIMIATISPAGGCLSETVNTLRYAKRTKRIVNEAIVNEDPKVRTIRELRKEIARLRGLLLGCQSVAGEGCSEEEYWRRWGVEAEGMKRSEGEGRGGVEGGDEKESVVNGSGKESFSHESQVFSDSLESLGSGLGRGGGRCWEEAGAGAGGGRVGVGSGEKGVGRREVGGMLHRSRPDLIKGISGRLKERLPSTSSTEMSNLSQSTSENSVNSSGSVEVQSVEGKGERGERGGGEGVRRERRSEIVEAVTTRLYVGQKKWEGRAKGGAEGEEGKLCKRARMKLFDLSRKLAQKRRAKRTVDSDTQTEGVRGTIRMKEKCVEADLGRGGEEERGRGCGRGRVSVLQESGTQTASEEKSDKSANTSPTELSQRDEEGFSDDSLDLDDDRRECVGGVAETNRGTNSEGGTPTYFRCFGDDAEGVKIEEPLFNGLPLSVLTEAEVQSEQRGSSYPSNSSLASRRDENPSSESSFTSVEGAELVSSSEASSEDFVFLETPKEREGATREGATRERELYTITENSEQSDGSEAFSPVERQRYCWNVGARGGGSCPGAEERVGVGGEGGLGGGEVGKGVRGSGRKTSWGECQASSEKQYLNLNISNSGKGPFSIDTNLFGKEWRKEQSAEGVFTSADSVTLVFMGPAKPKSSVLMEIIRRSLSGERSSIQRRSKSRGVQCDASLVRSVSVDTAMIALSRIARNQEQSPEMGRTKSLGALDPLETHTAATVGRSNVQKESSCQCDMESDWNAQKKKSALKCSVGTETTSCEEEESDSRRQKKRESAERPKKSVSWLGETKYDVELSWRPPEGVQRLPEATYSDSPPPAPIEPDSKILIPKQTSTDSSSDDLTTFLKEAIHLLRKMNSGSRHEVVADDTGGEGAEGQRSAEESEKGVLKRTKKGEVQGRGKGEGGEEREESGRLRGLREGEGGGAPSTWPRRRAGAGKPPTGLRGRLGRSGAAGRSESLHSSGLLDCSRSLRSGSSGNSWNYSRQDSGNWCFDEGRRQDGRSCCMEEGKWDRDVYVGGRMSPRTGKVDFDSLQEAERDLENCCRRLELAVEQDEAREKKSEGGSGLLESGGVGLWVECSRRRVGEGVKRRRRGECAGRCTCRPSARDPCKLLLTKGCQSSFELDSFGPGSNHCHQFCIFCRKKDVELYSSALNLNSECLSGVCRLNYYGYCPCSSVRLGHVTSSPRAYMQHLLTLRRQIVGGNSSSRSPRGHRGDTHALPCFSPS